MNNEPNITVGEVQDALTKQIFSENYGSHFEKLCRQRENGIKKFLDISVSMMLQHVNKPGLSSKELTYWKKAKSEICIKNLVLYAQKLVGELNKESIEAHCKKIGQHPISFFNPVFDPDITLLFVNSYFGAIVTDVYWIPDIPLHEVMAITGGAIDLSELGKRAPNIITQISKTIEKNKVVFQAYNDYIEIINEAVNCNKNHCNKAFNLLLLTSIEGLTRKLGKFLIEKQGLNKDPYSDEYNSLDAFLRKIPWKKDLKMSQTRHLLLTGQYKIDDETPADSPKAGVLVDASLKERLDFLRRRFKENRDLILHGQETEYDKPYQVYINACAILEVLETVVEYSNVYKN